MADANQEAEGQQPEAAREMAPDVFGQLLEGELGAKTAEMKEEVGEITQTLCQQVLANTELISDDAIKTIEEVIADIDKKLTEQINRILHNDSFRKLEGTWRGLSYLVNNTETDETLRIEILPITKKELSKTIKKFKGTKWDQSPLFEKIYEREFGTPNGEPYGCLIGDFEFGHSPPDVEMLAGMAQIAAAAHAPFISAADPSLLNLESWQELSNPRDVAKIFGPAQYAPWRSLRESEDSRYLGLTLPRFLSRLPYGEKTDPVDEFAFEEEHEGGDHTKYVWSNAAYAMGVNITRSFKRFGWCSQIRGRTSGGAVEGLPCHTFPTDDGGTDMKCPTEIAITDRREAELAGQGLMPLSHWKNTDLSVFVGAESLHKAAEFDDADATANAKLGARLPYLFATCRFAHFLKCIVRDMVGTFKERADMATYLNNWIMNYVEPDPSNATEEAKARRPLAEAEVVVEEIEGNPGYYSAKFFLRPHYQLEGLTVSLRLVSKLPSGKE